jgi:hypothetical protein
MMVLTVYSHCVRADRILISSADLYPETLPHDKAIEIMFHHIPAKCPAFFEDDIAT